MSRMHYTFEEFKEVYIAQPDGYFSVYSSFDENDDGENLRVVKLDMICEWRLPDGKVRFIEVEFSTKEQLDEIVSYLKLTADMLNKAILERIDRLDFSSTKESEDE